MPRAKKQQAEKPVEAEKAQSPGGGVLVRAFRKSRAPVRRELSAIDPKSIHQRGDAGLEVLDAAIEMLRERAAEIIWPRMVITPQQMEQVEKLARTGLSRPGICVQMRWRECRLRTVAKRAKEALQILEEGGEVTESEEMNLHCYLHLLRGEAQCEAELVCSIKAASYTDWRAAAHLLAKRKPKQWGARRDQRPTGTNVNVSVQAGVMIAPAPVASIADWEKANRIAPATTNLIVGPATEETNRE